MWAALARLMPADPEVHLSLGWAYHRVGHLGPAAAAYRAVVALRPDHVTAHKHLTVALAGLRRTAEAVAAARTAIRLDSGRRRVRLEPAPDVAVRRRDPAGRGLRRTRRVGPAVPDRRPAADRPPGRPTARRLRLRRLPRPPGRRVRPAAVATPRPVPIRGLRLQHGPAAGRRRDGGRAGGRRSLAGGPRAVRRRRRGSGGGRRNRRARRPLRPHGRAPARPLRPPAGGRPSHLPRLPGHDRPDGDGLPAHGRDRRPAGDDRRSVHGTPAPAAPVLPLLVAAVGRAGRRAGVGGGCNHVRVVQLGEQNFADDGPALGRRAGRGADGPAGVEGGRADGRRGQEPAAGRRRRRRRRPGPGAVLAGRRRLPRPPRPVRAGRRRPGHVPVQRDDDDRRRGVDGRAGRDAGRADAREPGRGVAADRRRPGRVGRRDARAVRRDRAAGGGRPAGPPRPAADDAGPPARVGTVRRGRVRPGRSRRRTRRWSPRPSSDGAGTGRFRRPAATCTAAGRGITFPVRSLSDPTPRRRCRPKPPPI